MVYLQLGLRRGRMSFITSERGALDGAFPVGLGDVDRQHGQMMMLRVLDQGRRMIEAERITIEHRGIEGGRMMAFEIGGGVGDQRETGGVRFRKAVQRKGS